MHVRIMNKRRRKVAFTATVTPPVANVPLTFTYNGKVSTVPTNTKGEASASFNWTGNVPATVKGMVNGVAVSAVATPNC